MGESPHVWHGVRQELPSEVTTHVPALRGADRVQKEAEIVVQSLQKCSDAGLVIVGHSLGGLVATAVAEQLAHSKAVRRLVLINTPPTLESRLAGNSAKERALRIPLVGRLIWSLASEGALRRSVSSAFAPGADIPDQAVTDLTLTGHRRLLAMNRAIVEYLGSKPLAARLHQLACPTDVLFGMLDMRVDSQSIRVHDQSRNTRVIRLENVGHSPPWEDPDAVARTILPAVATA
jgi:pimeloyl-ACP methyl ester carboxylesterase